MIQGRTGAEITLIEGRGGIFDITVDGKREFSKGQVGRFPNDDELNAIGVG